MADQYLQPGQALAVERRSWIFPGPLSLVALGVLYTDALRELVSDGWNDPNYSHGFLVLLFSGLLVWQQREKLKELTPQGSWWKVPVLRDGNVIHLSHISLARHASEEKGVEGRKSV